MLLKDETLLQDILLQLVEINQFTRNDCKEGWLQYNMRHCSLMHQYASILVERLHYEVDDHVLQLIAWSHDLFKEKVLDKKQEYKEFDNIKLPQDINRYIRTNMSILEKYNTDMYFNSDIQLHPQAASIFLYQTYDISEPLIIYPILFHSCPIMKVYHTLDENIRTLVDIIVLADKLSSNYLRIHSNKTTLFNLEQIVFGVDTNEFNFSLGLLVARLIAQGKSTEANSLESTAHYYARAKEINPLLMASSNLLKGKPKLWPKRKSLLVRTL